MKSFLYSLIIVLNFEFISAQTFAGVDHTYYYKGTLHYTDLTGQAVVPADETFVLKKEILPSKNMFVETATMRNYKGEIHDLTSIVNVKGNTVSAQSADGTANGIGFIQNVGTDGDFTYLNMTWVIGPNGATVKNINYITNTKLIARKEISNSHGVPTTLWESDMDLIPESDYLALYKKLHGLN